LVVLAVDARHAGGVGVLIHQQGLSLVLMATLLHDLTANTWTFVARLDAPLWSLATEWQFYLGRRSSPPGFDGSSAHGWAGGAPWRASWPSSLLAWLFAPR
jgi:hypothetical protein